jgi:hypothetical protein
MAMMDEFYVMSQPKPQVRTTHAEQASLELQLSEIIKA